MGNGVGVDSGVGVGLDSGLQRKFGLWRDWTAVNSTSAMAISVWVALFSAVPSQVKPELTVGSPSPGATGAGVNVPNHQYLPIYLVWFAGSGPVGLQTLEPESARVHVWPSKSAAAVPVLKVVSFDS